MKPRIAGAEARRGRLDIGIAGAGLLGRLLAWRLSCDGHAVCVFDPAAGPEPTFDGTGAAGFTAAGMLSPIAELDQADASIAALGWRSIRLWQQAEADLRERLPQADNTPLLVQRGSLLLAHRHDLPSAARSLARIAEASKSSLLALQSPPAPQPLSLDELGVLEPALHGPAHAWLLPCEAHIDAPRAMTMLHAAAASQGAQWTWNCPVDVEPTGTIHIRGSDDKAAFDHVFDVRGLGARPGVPVRGVRGETIWLHAPGHGLTRPVRLLHSRHRVYLVPRANDMLLLGASEIESDDRSPVSLRTAVELMAAAHSIMPTLAEARIIRLDRNLRPALPDNAPSIETSERITRINGLFRHGWLVAPALVEDALIELGLAPAKPRAAAVNEAASA